MHPRLDYLVGMELQAIDNCNDGSILLFSDQSAILVCAPWHWFCAGKRFPRDISPFAFFRGEDDLMPIPLTVSGISVLRSSLSLGIHINDQWTLRILSQDPEDVVWVACNQSKRIVAAGNGKFYVLNKP